MRAQLRHCWPQHLSHGRLTATFLRAGDVPTSRARCNNLIEAAEADEDIRKDGRMFLFTPKDFRQDLDDLKKGDFDSRMKGIAEDHRWVSKLRDIGDSVAFQDTGRPFHLEVVNVTSSASDHREVALRVCEY